MELRKEAGEAFFQEMQVPRSKAAVCFFSTKCSLFTGFFLVKRWEKVGGGSGVVVVVSTREKQKNKGKTKKKKNKHLNMGGFHAHGLINETPKNVRTMSKRLLRQTRTLAVLVLPGEEGLQFQPQEVVCCELLAQEILEIWKG